VFEKFILLKQLMLLQKICVGIARERIKYSMCDLICDVIVCCVWSCDMGKINASDKIMFENQKKKRKCVHKRNFYI